MALHVKGIFVFCLLLIILMEEAKPALAKKEKLKKKVEELEKNVTKLEDRMKAIEECDACSKIKELNETVQGIIDAKPELAYCGDPGVPKHGSKTGENYWEGGTVTFTCDAGYHLEGSANLVCLENGKWNNALPKCSKHASGVAGLEDSVILNNDASFLEALSDFLEPVTDSDTQWNRCWQASVDGWAASTFHSLCDDKGPTVTIVRVNHKYIFGGYTSLSWGGSCGFQYDSTAFLFSLVNNPGWQPLKMDQTGKYGYDRTYSIRHCSDHGPAFGSYDFIIADHADQASPKPESYSTLGNTYAPPTGYSYGDPFANTFLASTQFFQPDEIEVFYETT